MSYLQKTLTVRKGLIVVVLFPFLDFVDDLVKCRQVCRGFHTLLDPMSKFCVNFSNLFEAQGSVITDESDKVFVYADTLEEIH